MTNYPKKITHVQKKLKQYTIRIIIIPKAQVKKFTQISKCRHDNLSVLFTAILPDLPAAKLKKNDYNFCSANDIDHHDIPCPVVQLKI